NDPQNNQKTVSKQSEKTVSNNVRGNTGRCAQIAQAMMLQVLGKALERLRISSGRADAVDPAVVMVVMPALAQGKLPGNGMFRLGSG
ncbi:MAG: hypothetical protein ACYC9M_13435, partial [Desulfobulbaceae bacterium]